MTRTATRRVPRSYSVAVIAGIVAYLLSACGSSSSMSPEEEHRRQDAALAQGVVDDVSVEPENPFRDAQSLAEDSMGAAATADIDQSWLRMMVEHQEGSARIAEILLRSRPSPAGKKMAEAVRQNSHTRVGLLQRFREPSVTAPRRSKDVFGPVISNTFAEMTKARGATVDETWALKMAAYNRGAIKLAGIEVTRGGDERIKGLARELASALAYEADEFDRLARTRNGDNQTASQ